MARELKDLDRKTREIMIIHGALHPKSVVNRIDVWRERGARVLISCEKCKKSEVKSLG